MPTRRKPTAKQRAAQKAWKERQERREAWQAGKAGSGAVPLEGDDSWALQHAVPRAFDTVVEDMKAVCNVRFGPGHVDPQRIAGWPVAVIVGVREDGTYVQRVPVTSEEQAAGAARWLAEREEKRPQPGRLRFGDPR